MGTQTSHSCGSCSDNHDIFRCGQKGECDFGPDSGSRRHCQLCRFNKCLRYDYKTKHGNNPVFPLSLSGPELFTAQTIEARCYYYNNRPLINFTTTSNMPPSRSFVRLGLGLITAQKTCTLFRAGMRVTWVLSQQEQERRFTKLKVKNEGKMQTSKKMSIGRSLNPCFTIEEKALLEDVCEHLL